MATNEKIKEVFDFYKVSSEVDSSFGDWVVSNEADVINVENMYPIYTPQVRAEGLDSWLDHMREKTWFNRSEEENFSKAYERARAIVSGIE